MRKMSRSEAGKLGFEKSYQTQQIQKQKRIDQYLKTPSICNHCNSILDYKSRSKKFCCKSCAASYNNKNRSPRTEDSKKKTSLTINRLLKEGKIIPKKGNNKEIKYIGPYTPIKRKKCTNCNKEFWAAGAKVTCSDLCRHERSAYNNVRKQHIKFFNCFDQEYVFLHSNWEIIIAKWLEEQNISWSRPKEVLYWYDKENKKRRYTPDFFIKKINLYVDVKNPLKISQEKEKLNILKSNYNLLIGNIEECQEGILAALL